MSLQCVQAINKANTNAHYRKSDTGTVMWGISQTPELANRQPEVVYFLQTPAKKLSWEIYNDWELQDDLVPPM